MDRQDGQTGGQGQTDRQFEQNRTGQGTEGRKVERHTRFFITFTYTRYTMQPVHCLPHTPHTTCHTGCGLAACLLLLTDLVPTYLHGSNLYYLLFHAIPCLTTFTTIQLPCTTIARACLLLPLPTVPSYPITTCILPSSFCLVGCFLHFMPTVYTYTAYTFLPTLPSSALTLDLLLPTLPTVPYAFIIR